MTNRKAEARAIAYTALNREAHGMDGKVEDHPEYTLIGDCEIDSLAVVSVAIEVEEALGITITDDDYENTKTVGDFVAMIEAKVSVD